MTTEHELTVLAPLSIEARAVADGLPGVPVRRTGIGVARSRRAAAELAGLLPAGAPVAVMGFCGALDPTLRPGDVVVADSVLGDDVVVSCPESGPLVAELRRRGLTVHHAPLLTTGSVVYSGARRARLRQSGAIAVDMESAALLDGVGERPRVAVRVVLDGPGRPLVHPRTLPAVSTAQRALRHAAPGVLAWAQAGAARTVLLAGPRSFCAGVERAIEVVAVALERFSPPVYVRKQIVHNIHVVRDLERRGAVFVDELDEVPEGARVVFSAHGVSPEVRSAAVARGLDVIDATCPLVSKVHAEARRFAARGDTIVLVGHAGHEEVEGTTGEAPDAIRLVEEVGDVERLDLPADAPVSYLMQTTLAVADSAKIVDALRQRYPQARGPETDDICYATSNRQAAVAAIARESDLVLVLGSDNSSNSKRLAEIVVDQGRPAYLIDDETELEPQWLYGARTVGVTAGASAPPELVDRLVAALAGLGRVEVTERSVVSESVQFSLPKEVS